MEEKFKFQYEGVKWLYEMELLNHPQLINNLKLNIFATSTRIKEVEFLIYRERKAMLVLLDLSWLGRKFFKKKIFHDVQDVLSQLLPSFQFRVTDDTKIMEMAVEKVKKVLGKIDEVRKSNSDIPNKHSSTELSKSETKSTTEGAVTDSSSDSEKQPRSSEDLLNSTGTNDSSKQSKV